MSAAKHGDTVKVHYTGSLADGSEFDSSLGRDPLEFVLGGGNIITGFEKAVTGMCTGKDRTQAASLRNKPYHVSHNNLEHPLQKPLTGTWSAGPPC